MWGPLSEERCTDKGLVAEDQDYDANGLSSDQVQNKRELTVNLCLDLVLSLLKKIVLQVQEPPQGYAFFSSFQLWQDGPHSSHTDMPVTPSEDD